MAEDIHQKRVCLLGKGTLAVRIATWFDEAPDYALVAVVPVVPEPTWTESLIDWCESRNVPYLADGDYRSFEGTCDLGFSVFYDKIIRADFIDRCGRLLNLHNGPLPRYRGVSPINWALKNEEPNHGATIHEITPGIDDGPIVAQVEYSIYPELDEVEDVYARSVEFGWTLFLQTMPLLDRIEARPQDSAAATYYSRADDERLGTRRGFRRA